MEQETNPEVIPPKEETPTDGLSEKQLLENLNTSLDELTDYLKEHDLTSDEVETAFRKEVSEYIKAELAPSETVSTDGDMVALLTEIRDNTVPSVNSETMEQALYYGNLSIYFLVVYVLPCYIAYRILKGLFGLVRSAV